MMIPAGVLVHQATRPQRQSVFRHSCGSGWSVYLQASTLCVDSTDLFAISTRPLRGSVSCGSGWSVPCVSIQLTLLSQIRLGTLVCTTRGRGGRGHCGTGCTVLVTGPEVTRRSTRRLASRNFAPSRYGISDWYLKCIPALVERGHEARWSGICMSLCVSA